MKKTIAALLLLSLCLTGCGSFLERESLTIDPHSMVPAAEGNSSILRAENYQGLVNAILYFVSQGQEEGTLRLYDYAGDVDFDLGAACLEVSQDDPLGAYALDFIRFETDHIISYYEVDFYFTYRRTREQLDRILSVVGNNAIRQELCAALAGFREETALRIVYFDQDEEYLLELLRQAYHDTPQSALGMPQAEISLYPDTGSQRIVEFRLTYPDSQEAMLAQQAEIRAAAGRLTASVAGLSAGTALPLLVQALREETGFDPQGNSSVSFLLTDEPADSEGLALAMALCCQQLELTCYVVEGTLNGTPRFWTVVGTEEGYFHLDPAAEEPGFRSDNEMEQLGFRWDRTAVPACGEDTE